MSSAHLLPIRCTLLSGMNNNVQKFTDFFSQLNYTSFMAFSIAQSKGTLKLLLTTITGMSLDTSGEFCPDTPSY